MCGVVPAREGRRRRASSSSMKARGGLQVRWRWVWLMMIQILVWQLLVGEAAARGLVVPIEIYVGGERNSQEVAGSLYRVEILGDGSGGGRGCLLCCEFEAPAQTGNLTQKVKCGASGAAAFQHTVRSDRPPSASSSSSSPSVCLLVKDDAALSVGGGGEGNGRRNWQVDAALSLAMYLKWMRGDGGGKGNNAEGSVQTQAACRDSRCRITVRAGSGGPEVATISSSNSAGGSLEWWSAGGGLPSEWIQKWSLALRGIPAAAAGQQSTDGAAEWSRAAARRSGRYIRGWFSSISEAGAETKIQSFPGEEQIVVTLSSSRNMDTQRRAGGTDKEQLVGTDLSLQVPQIAAGAQAGRRSLQARMGEAANASHSLCKDGRLRYRCSGWTSLVLGVAVCLAGVSMLAILCAHGTKETATPTDFLESVPSLPPRFSYGKLQKATKNFSRKLGDGAFGSVYEGTLPNGSRVAVKMLEKTSVQGEKQFRAEVASMGAIRHLNLVRLHGFCSEGSHRLLVYEFMPNGSLDSWLFGKKQGEKLLDWEQRLNIALGTARALAYLHEECSDHIIHLDVKPENILLDHQFCPKLSDFGLAKLMDREQSRVVTSMRGTPGYLAPEWLLPHAAVTAKTDVYSFGMVLLELISGRENTNFSLGKEQWYFPAWAFKLMGEGRTMELLDKRLHVEEVEYFHKKDAVRAIHCALLCIQDDPAVRPPMSRVVHMLQGHVEPEPLNARQAAIQPPRRLMTAFAASMSDIDVNDHQRNNNHNNIHNNHNNNSNHNNNNTNININNEMHRNDTMANQNSGGVPVVRAPPILESPRVMESPKVMESPRVPLRLPPPQTLEDLEEEKVSDRMQPLPAAIQVANQQSRSNKQRMAGVHSMSTNQKYIPPWPVKGDVILFRGLDGDMHGVVRDVRVQTKQMRLAVLHRLSSETRWSVREEEQIWRHWNESVKTLDFWVVVRWSTIPGRGFEKFPVEWMVR